MRALFLTWDGSQQTYLETLFFPIFAELRKLGAEVEVLQRTSADGAALEATERAAKRLGIEYSAERTSRRFGIPGQLTGVVRGARLAVYAGSLGLQAAQRDRRELGARLFGVDACAPAWRAAFARLGEGAARVATA